MTAITEPYKLTIGEGSHARAAYSWSMYPSTDAEQGPIGLMLHHLKQLSPQARQELLWTTEVFVGSLATLVQQDYASGALAPKPLPLAVEGICIGQRVTSDVG